MKYQPQLADMIKGQLFDGYLLIRAAAQRTSSNGSKYLDLTLCDISGEVNAKMWDSNMAAPDTGSVMRVRGLMTEFKEKPQLRVDRMRAITEKDDVDMGVLAPCAPKPADEMLGGILACVDTFSDEAIARLVRARLDECGAQLKYYPAAMKLHHAERAGLLHHTSTMLEMAQHVCQVYPTLDRDLLCAGVILHDLCKIGEMDADEIGIVSDYTPEGMLIGHLVRGVAELDRCGRALNTPDETLMLLEHMILSHHDLPEYGSPKPPMFPEAEVLHILDLLDARIFEMNRALATIQPGHFTDRIWSLERKLYRRKTADGAQPPRDEPEQA